MQPTKKSPDVDGKFVESPLAVTGAAHELDVREWREQSARQMSEAECWFRSFLPEAADDREVLRERIQEGFADGIFKFLMGYLEVSRPELARNMQIPPSTLKRRLDAGRFNARESDRLYSCIHLVDVAEKTFGSREDAVRWLKTPNKALGGTTPFSFSETGMGAREVENLLLRIGYGVFS